MKKQLKPSEVFSNWLWNVYCMVSTKHASYNGYDMRKAFDRGRKYERELNES